MMCKTTTLPSGKTDVIHYTDARWKTCACGKVPKKTIINQEQVEELRKNPRYIEFHIKPNVRAHESEITEPFLVGVLEGEEFYLQPKPGSHYMRPGFSHSEPEDY